MRTLKVRGCDAQAEQTEGGRRWGWGDSATVALLCKSSSTDTHACLPTRTLHHRMVNKAKQLAEGVEETVLYPQGQQALLCQGKRERGGWVVGQRGLVGVLIHARFKDTFQISICAWTICKESLSLDYSCELRRRTYGRAHATPPPFTLHRAFPRLALSHHHTSLSPLPRPHKE